MIDFVSKRKKCDVCTQEGAIYSIMRGRADIKLCKSHISSKFKQLFLEAKGKLIVLHPTLPDTRRQWVYQFFDSEGQKNFKSLELDNSVRENMQKLEGNKQVAYYSPQKILYVEDSTGMMMPNFAKMEINPEFVSVENVANKIKDHLTNSTMVQPIVIPQPEDNGTMFISEI